MDYLIFGLGVGATLVLVGWLVRNFGPVLRDREREDDQVKSALELIERMAWARFCRAAGTALALEGALLLGLTLLMIAIQPSDRVGTIIVGIGFGLVVAGMIAWAFVFTARFGIQGIYRQRAQASAAHGTGFDDEPDGVDDVSDTNRRPQRRPEAPLAAGAADEDDTFEDADDSPESQDQPPDDEPMTPGRRSLEDVLGIPARGEQRQPAVGEVQGSGPIGGRTLEEVLGLPVPESARALETTGPVPAGDEPGAYAGPKIVAADTDAATPGLDTQDQAERAGDPAITEDIAEDTEEPDTSGPEREQNDEDASDRPARDDEDPAPK